MRDLLSSSKQQLPRASLPSMSVSPRTRCSSRMSIFSPSSSSRWATTDDYPFVVRSHAGSEHHISRQFTSVCVIAQTLIVDEAHRLKNSGVSLPHGQPHLDSSLIVFLCFPRVIAVLVAVHASSQRVSGMHFLMVSLYWCGLHKATRTVLTSTKCSTSPALFLARA